MGTQNTALLCVPCVMVASVSSGFGRAVAFTRLGDIPERRALYDNLDCPWKFMALGERLINVYGILGIVNAKFGNEVVRIASFEKPWRRACGPEYPCRSCVRLCGGAEGGGGVVSASRTSGD